MSLYSFGAFVTRDGHRLDLSDCANIFDDIDASDCNDLIELTNFSLPQFFSIKTSHDSNDATAVWNEAMAASQETVQKTALGNAVHWLMFNHNIRSGAIAFVDGGIEKIMSGNIEISWQHFLDALNNHWDSCGNILIVWHR